MTLVLECDTGITAPQVHLQNRRGQRSIRAQWSPGPVLQITAPHTHHLQHPDVQYLISRAIQQFKRHNDLWQALGTQQALLFITEHATLQAFVDQVNQQTLKAPVAGVRLGRATKRTLGSMNIKTRVMTLSAAVLKGIPEGALRYLVIHELCHLTHANHSQAFWQLVKTHMPNYKAEKALLQAHHFRVFLGH
jgi:predicted metal-dependent hydrolase